MTATRDLYDPSMTVRLGIAGHAMLAFGVPASLATVIAPITGAGLDGIITGLVVALVVAVPLAVMTPIALIRRPRWGRGWAAAVSRILLFGWAATLALALGYPLGFVHARSDAGGSLAFLGWTGLVFVLVLTIPAVLVWRLLRDPAVRG